MRSIERTRNAARASRVNATIKLRTLSLGVKFTARGRWKTGTGSANALKKLELRLVLPSDMNAELTVLLRAGASRRTGDQRTRMQRAIYVNSHLSANWPNFIKLYVRSVHKSSGFNDQRVQRRRLKGQRRRDSR